MTSPSESDVRAMVARLRAHANGCQQLLPGTYALETEAATTMSALLTQVAALRAEKFALEMDLGLCTAGMFSVFRERLEERTAELAAHRPAYSTE